MYAGVAVPVSYYRLYVSCSGVHFSLRTVHVCATPSQRRTRSLTGAESTCFSMWRPGSPRDPDGGGPSRWMDLSRSLTLGVSRGHVQWGGIEFGVVTRGYCLACPGDPRSCPMVRDAHVRSQGVR